MRKQQEIGNSKMTFYLYELMLRNAEKINFELK